MMHVGTSSHMWLLRCLAAFLFFLVPLTCAQAQGSYAPPSLTLLPPMVADSSLRTVEIHSSFNGADLLLFGAQNEAGDLVLVVRGPRANTVLRRKARIAGMWMHVEQQKYPALPMFFGMATTKPIEEILSPALQTSLQLGTPTLLATSNPRGLPHFNDALTQHLTHWGLWQDPAQPITFFGESLFKTTLHLPDRLPHGNFTIEAYLFLEGRLMSMQTIPLRSYATGFEANLHHAAENHAWAYGIFAIVMALAGGWLAHRLFHR